MATYAEIEDLRDWMIDNCGDLLAKFDDLNGDESAEVINQLRRLADSMHERGLEVIKSLDEILIQKKRDA